MVPQNEDLDLFIVVAFCSTQHKALKALIVFGI